MKILGFQSGHDVGYCILENGIPIIHEELERFIREKEPLGDGLKMASEILSDDDFNEIQHFCYGNPGGRRPSVCHDEESENKMSEVLSNNGGKLYMIGHHQSHAANAFFSSNFDEALIITLDGSGTEKSNWQDIHSEKSECDSFSVASTFWEGKGTKIKPIKRTPTMELTIGGPWRRCTKGIFGLSAGHPHGLAAGTIMAMASVGDSEKYWEDFYNCFKAYGGGGSSSWVKTISKYKEIAKISEQESFDVAAGLQKATEVIGYETMKPIIEKYKPKNICMSGGVCLNSVMIGKMHDWFEGINIYICPVPYDGGLAIGSAQYVWHQVLGNPRVKWEDNCTPYLGRTYEKDDVIHALEESENIKNRLKEKNVKLVCENVNDDKVIDLLINQNIISVHGGGSESGRRALGNRSILCDPRSPDMKAIINEKVKHRQWFRPFAPSILRENVSEWFEHDIDSPYMTVVLRWKEEVKDKVPAVVHLDGTGRLQTVTKNDNEWYYKFIKKFGDKTGVPILLNTSFNDREPIVETPEHAIDCFLRTNIDYLYFREFSILVHKEKNK